VAHGFEATPNNYSWSASSNLTNWTSIGTGSSYIATYSNLPYFPYYIKLQYGNDYITYATLNEIQSGESPLMLEISSSTGTLFINGNISTTLIATVWQGSENVTAQYSGQFYWYKNGAAYSSTNHTNSVTVSAGDVD
jgi:hypothetical protein